MMRLVTPATTLMVPRLGFLGVGWIGRSRLQALVTSGAGSVAAVCDTDEMRAREVSALAQGRRVSSCDELLQLDIDGIVIATPSAMHAEQCIAALERGLAVFCQKPLARTAAETERVVAAARAADRLLGVDLSYRHTAAAAALRDAVRAGRIGAVHAAELKFHNAYGPDPGWARDPRLAGGGCVIDLGTHLVDLALWTLDFPTMRRIDGQRFARGRRLEPREDVCEDFATATLELDGGAVVRVSCSWESSTGRDAVIEAAFFGSEGGAVLRNVDGSFFDFTAELFHGTTGHTLAAPPDDWGGRALIEWTRHLATDNGYDPAVETVIEVACALDGMLER
jgi:predicted dehydrogenase